MKPELEPCPLCRGSVTLTSYEYGASWNGKWEIECYPCSLTLTLHYIQDIAKPKKADSKAFNKELAITRWNRRAR